MPTLMVSAEAAGGRMRFTTGGVAGKLSTK
jgi:hypothetical protein